MATHKHRRIRTTSLLGEARRRAGARSPLRSSRRRGVILLVLLGMLALFAATAFAFVVIASHANRAAKSLQNAGREVFSPRLDLEEGLRQVLRDTVVPASAVRGHSLMLDLYGDNALYGWVINGFTLSPGAPGYMQPKGLAVNLLPGIPTSINAHQSGAAGGQVIEFTAGYTLPAGSYWGGLIPDIPEGNPSAGQLATAGGNVATTLTVPPWFGMSGTNAVANEPFEFQRRVGCVITVIDPSSPLYNKSTRIVAYRRQPISNASGTVIYHRYQVLPFEGVSALDTVNYFKTTRSDGPDFVINGTPFSGTGAGYNPNNPLPTAKILNNWGYTDAGFQQPFALLPNPTDPNYCLPTGTHTPYSPNEDYDAPDYQNMLMAFEHWDSTAGRMVVRSPSLHRPALAQYWVYRLVNQIMTDWGLTEDQALRVVIQPFEQDGNWVTVPPAAIPPLNHASLIDRAKIATVKRRCLLRPLPEDHNAFDGSNPSWPTFIGTDISGYTGIQLWRAAFQAWGATDAATGVYEPWDVDNDGDGVPDSVWVDIGLPVRSLPDGRKYKPMVAMHCVDQDGKINLNTAGSLEQLANKYSHDSALYPGNPVNSDELRADYFVADGVVYAQKLIESVGPANDATSNVSLRRGQGSGPAEISLYPTFYEIVRNDPTYFTPLLKHNYAMLLYRNLMLGWKGLLNSRYVEFDGRYGELYERTGAEFQKPAPGQSNTAEALAMARLFGMADTYNYVTYLAGGTPTPWGSPLDLKGAMTVGLDVFGQPIYSNLRPVAASVNPLGYVVGSNQLAFASSLVDTPYELRLGRLAAQDAGSNAGRDNPFTVAEFEPFLRRFDADVYRLPGRLRQLLNAGPGAPYRFMATTESWDIPVPAMALPKELLDDWQVLGLDPSTDEDHDPSTDDSPDLIPDRIRPPLHIGDLIAARIHSLDTGGSFLPTGLSHPSALVPSASPVEGAKRVDIAELLGTDLLSGLRMDLNRPFGNGIDDDGDGTVDEPSERLTLATAGRFEMFNGSAATRFDHDNDGWEYRDHNGDGTVDAADDDPSLPGALAEHLEASPVHDRIYKYRQAYARHLYVLMMALVDEAWYPEWDPVIARKLNADSKYDPSDTEKQAARARAIAQWAINVVDFRDSDSIMTPFEYDIYPFAAPSGTVPAGQLISTWNADGDPTTTELGCDVVYGCERPELLITETLAFHDRRTEDTDEEQPDGATTTDATDPDADFDQKYRPLGSFYVELYNPSSPSEPSPAELYGYPNTGGVVLTQTTQPGGGDPVWRLAVTVSAANADIHAPPDYDYVNPDIRVDDSAEDFVRERLVYFIRDNGSLPELGAGPTNYKVAYTPSGVQPSVNPANFSAVRPRCYMVIGPGMNDGNGNINTTTQIGDVTAGPARRITLDPTAANQVAVWGDGAVNDVAARGAAIQSPSAIVIDSPQRLSVSEPTSTTYAALATGSTYNGVSQMFSPPDDRPLDSFDPEDPTQAHPEWAKIGENGTHAAFRYVHLQRLADPTRPYHPLANPYRTIDTAPVDLTVFNGRTNASDPGVGTGTYAKDAAGNDSLNSRQRGDRIASASGPPPLWQSHIPDVPGDRPMTNQTPSPVADHVFDKRFAHTLGWVNEWYGQPLSPAAYNVGAAYAGAPGLEAGASPNREFTPQPFPWIAWLNRPFANPLELLQVPAVESSRLLTSYENDLTKATAAGDFYKGGHEGFSHLSAFFAALPGPINTAAVQTDSGLRRLRGVTDAGTSIPVKEAADFYRILEYVHVPTRFVNSYTHGYDAALMGQRPGEPPHLLHPPFNTVSDYREPGKINLNTLQELLVWHGLAGDDAELATASSVFWNARRAYGNPATGPFGIDPLASAATPPLPTRVANPFRSFAGEYLLPPVPGRDVAGPPYDPYLPHVVQEGVNATLLRAQFNPANPVDPLNNRSPLFARSSPPREYDHLQKNPYFQYESLSRLSNLTTTRSNVYAIWITVGYFEVEKYSLYDPNVSWHKHVYPEGYTIGQELGVDSGDVRRHRAFYVIDRSIPVGFVPGQDLNTEKAVLLRRFIE